MDESEKKRGSKRKAKVEALGDLSAWLPHRAVCTLGGFNMFQHVSSINWVSNWRYDLPLSMVNFPDG
jgi:hypothetical protein